MSTPEPAIDLRSDTVTQPSRAMREAMLTAAVGDDVYGEDPTVIELERRTAEILGKVGVLVNATGEHSLRAVTHRDVTFEQVKRAAERLCEALSS